MTDEYLENVEKRYPIIKWREPIWIEGPGVSGWACRVCIAKVGLRFTEDEEVPRAVTYVAEPAAFGNEDEIREHIRVAHVEARNER